MGDKGSNHERTLSGDGTAPSDASNAPTEKKKVPPARPPPPQSRAVGQPPLSQLLPQPPQDHATVVLQQAQAQPFVPQQQFTHQQPMSHSYQQPHQPLGDQSTAPPPPYAAKAPGTTNPFAPAARLARPDEDEPPPYTPPGSVQRLYQVTTNPFHLDPANYRHTEGEEDDQSPLWGGPDQHRDQEQAPSVVLVTLGFTRGVWASLSAEQRKLRLQDNSRNRSLEEKSCWSWDAGRTTRESMKTLLFCPLTCGLFAVLRLMAGYFGAILLMVLNAVVTCWQIPITIAYFYQSVIFKSPRVGIVLKIVLTITFPLLACAAVPTVTFLSALSMLWGCLFWPIGITLRMSVRGSMAYASAGLMMKQEVYKWYESDGPVIEIRLLHMLAAMVGLFIGMLIGAVGFLGVALFYAPVVVWTVSSMWWCGSQSRSGRVAISTGDPKLDEDCCVHCSNCVCGTLDQCKSVAGIPFKLIATVATMFMVVGGIYIAFAAGVILGMYSGTSAYSRFANMVRGPCQQVSEFQRMLARWTAKEPSAASAQSLA
eukprot:m.248839 g.248839  ORF g.248839 m.248839 type:complete len:539 (+) comp19080_c2_seq19:2699-4315(+)